MKQSVKKIAYCLPVMVVILITMLLTSPTASAAQLKTPVLNAPVNTVSGVKMSWKKVAGAQKYRVYVKTGSSSWKKLADTANTYYLHKAAKSGTTYTYTVRCITKNGMQTTSNYNRTGKRITYIKAPAISSLTNTATGPSITWGAVKGASRYRVFVKTGSSSWTKLADTTARTYVHQKAVPGTKYTYTVRCLSADAMRFISDYNAAGKAITYIARPTLSLSNDAGGIRLNWTRPSGSGRYRVMLYRNGARVKLTDTTDTSYLYPASASNTAYTFTVRCLNSTDTAFSSAAAVQKTITYIAAPRITGVTNEPNGAKITWGAVSGAAQYRVLLYEGDTWKTLAQTDALSYTHDAEHESYYTYAVCCLDERENVISGFYDYGYTHQYLIPAGLDTPVITAFENREDGLSLSWDAVEGAEKYRVLKKQDDRWTTLIETTDASCLDTAVATGESLTYTVCCISDDGKSYMSPYDAAGSTHIYYGAPAIQMTNTAFGILLGWDGRSDVNGYRLYLKNGDTWSYLLDTTENNYLYTDAVDGEEYAFTVCYLNENGEPLGPYREEGASFTYAKDKDNVIYTAEAFAAEISRTLGKSEAVATPAGAVLNRRNASEILCKALGYPSHTKGVDLLDTDSNALKTAVFLGYFYPNESNRIYPEALITDVEYKDILTEVGRYAKLRGKKALAFGDSIMYGYGNNGYGSCRIICEKYGMTFINYSYCGATFGTCSNGRVHIPDRIKAAHTAGYTADIIFLNGGTNDLSLIRKGQTPDTFDPKNPASSTFSEGFEYSMMLIRYYWGNTPVLYTRNHNMVVSSEALEQQLGEYGLKIANKYYAHIVDIYTDTDLDTENTAMRDRYTMYRADLGRSDGIHPNYLGYTAYYLPLETKAILSILLP